MMENQETYEFRVLLGAKDLWHFSMYHAHKGYLGIFNLLFTLAALYLLVVTWNQNTVAQRLLLVFCAMVFTVIQPGQLYLKAKKQASLAVMKEPVSYQFAVEGISIEQGGQGQDLTWDQMGRVEAAKGLVIIYMDRVHAYLITDAAMGAQKEGFFKLLQEVLPKERRKRI